MLEGVLHLGHGREEGVGMCGRGRRRLMLDGFADGRERDGMGRDGRRCGFSALLGELKWVSYRHDWGWIDMKRERVC